MNRRCTVAHVASLNLRGPILGSAVGEWWLKNDRRALSGYSELLMTITLFSVVNNKAASDLYINYRKMGDIEGLIRRSGRR